MADHIWKYDSPLGGITLSSDGIGLTGLWFDGQKHFASTLPPASSVSSSPAAASFPSRFKDLLVEGFSEEESSVFEQSCRWLDIYFTGRDPGFTPPLSLRGTPFRLAVWAELLNIPFGQTMTYGALAKRLSTPHSSDCPPSIPSLSSDDSSPCLSTFRCSARAVGGAVGHNPVSLIVPCHRVIGANGSMTGYAGGLDRKLRLLWLEGISLDAC